MGYNSRLWTGTLNIISTNPMLSSVIVDSVIGVKVRPNKHFGMERHLNHWFPPLSHGAENGGHAVICIHGNMALQIIVGFV